MSERHGVPSDTLAPMVVALGAMFILGGVIWSPISAGVGLVLVILGLARWIDLAWEEPL